MLFRSEMTTVASRVAAGGAADVASAGVATSDTGVGVGGSGVEKTTIVVSLVAGVVWRLVRWRLQRRRRFLQPVSALQLFVEDEPSRLGWLPA